MARLALRQARLRKGGVPLFRVRGKSSAVQLVFKAVRRAANEKARRREEDEHLWATVWPLVEGRGGEAPPAGGRGGEAPTRAEGQGPEASPADGRGGESPFATPEKLAESLVAKANDAADAKVAQANAAADAKVAQANAAAEAGIAAAAADAAAAKAAAAKAEEKAKKMCYDSCMELAGAAADGGCCARCAKVSVGMQFLCEENYYLCKATGRIAFG